MVRFITGGSGRAAPAALRELRQKSAPHYHYLLSLPPGYSERPDTAWPLILFLHGVGEGGPGGISKVKFHGPPRLVAAYGGDAAAAAAGTRPEPVNAECAALVAESAITVSPQVDYSRHGDGWAVDGLVALLDELMGPDPRVTAAGSDPRVGSTSAGPQEQRPQLRTRGGGSGVGGSGGGSSSGGGSAASRGSSREGSGGGGGGGSEAGGGGGHQTLGPVPTHIVHDACGDPVTLPLRVDPDRVYVTGLSMGGYGTWRLGVSHPDRFAALAPVCGGGGSPWVAARAPAALRRVPVWNFHGEMDDVIRVSESEKMMAPLLAQDDSGGAQVRFTRYPDLTHDSWTRAYNTPALWRWLLSHSRRDRRRGSSSASGGTAGGGGGGGGSGSAGGGGGGSSGGSSETGAAVE